MKTRTIAFIIAVLALFALIGWFLMPQDRVAPEVMAEYEVWKEGRLEEMRGEETTWLNLAGLFWLGEGAATFGGDPSNEHVLRVDMAPPFLGQFIREGETVYFEPAADVQIETVDGPVSGRLLLMDDGGEEMEATVLMHGSLRWWIILRDGMVGVRVRDLESAAWKAFKGFDTYPYNPDWRVKAEFVPFDEPRSFEYPTILGTTRTEKAPGLLVFQHDGQQYEMIPFERYEGTKFYLVLGDETNGAETYDGGRFLYTDLPDASGYTFIDFNRAYNPPCAFSDFSTCPQPLRQNRLPFAITAGERMYKK